ncbi:MAG: carbohydrate ABC transporter permease [Anaerolineae bacterium]|nr:carbohydrate ABC transporter permease [Anaerolineae bacterium]
MSASIQSSIAEAKQGDKPQAVAVTHPSKFTKIVQQLPTYVVLIFLAILFLFPFYVIGRNALMTRREITGAKWVWLPAEPQFENLTALFSDKLAPMATGLKNSLFIATADLILQMLLASMAGYGLARIPYRWRNLVFYFLIATIMIPGAVTFIPKYVIVASFGWINTLQGLIIPNAFNVFACFVFRQFYLNFPQELVDAGRVDGLTYWGVYRSVVLPNSRSVFAALGVLAFFGSWNSFVWPLVIGQNQSSWTVQIVLSTFMTAQTVNLPALFMGAAVGILPLFVLFLIFQRYIAQGVTFTGLKG